jgi:sulfate adenylyltransferase
MHLVHNDPVPLPQYCPSPRELDDLELLLHGVLGDPRFEPGAGLVTLQAPASAVGQGEIELVDPEGVPLARVTVEETYPAGDLVGVVGPVQSLQHNEFGAYRDLHLTPHGARSLATSESVTVPITAPLTVDDLASIREQANGRAIVLLALTGHGLPSHRGRALSGVGLLRATLAAAEDLDDVHVVAAPLASRGPGRHDDDLMLAERVAEAYAAGEVIGVPGTGELPEHVAAVVDFELPDPTHQGLVLFFTGLSGSGKSTLARALFDVILERGERTITSLDGDVVRRNLSAGLTFSKEDRETNIKRIGWVAAEISRHRGIAICSPIAPFDSTRQAVRKMVGEAGGAFFLIHVATPLEECERRDRKGLYAKARRGEIPEFTGISSPYEEPEDADVSVDTTGRSIEDALGDVLTALDKAGYLTSATGDS